MKNYFKKNFENRISVVMCNLELGTRSFFYNYTRLMPNELTFENMSEHRMHEIPFGMQISSETKLMIALMQFAKGWSWRLPPKNKFYISFSTRNQVSSQYPVFPSLPQEDLS